MATAEKPREKSRNKRVFLASSQADAIDVRAAMRHFNLDAVTLEQAATPGTTWVDSLHRCVSEADMVIGVMRDRRKEMSIFFELGVATALNKPTLLFISPDYPIDVVPPSGIPYLRMDLKDQDAVAFGLQQALSLSPRERTHHPASGFTTRPIGALADHLLVKLRELDPMAGLQFEDLIFEAIKASGASTIARGDKTRDLGLDFAIWSSDLEPTVANPLLVECKFSLRNQSEFDEAIGRMVRALGAVHVGFGLVLYKDAQGVPQPAPRSLPVVFLSAEEFISGLRDTGLAEYVRKLRNALAHGF